MQGVVPLQTRGQVPEVGHHHLRADPFQPVHAAKEPHGGHRRVRVSHGHHLDRHGLALADHFAQGARFEMPPTGVDDLGQFVEMREPLHGPDYEG